MKPGQSSKAGLSEKNFRRLPRLALPFPTTPPKSSATFFRFCVSSLWRTSRAESYFLSWPRGGGLGGGSGRGRWLGGRRRGRRVGRGCGWRGGFRRGARGRRDRGRLERGRRRPWCRGRRGRTRGRRRRECRRTFRG